MKNEKQKYIYERILTIKDRLKTLYETMELIHSDIKFIEEISKSEKSKQS
jgi:hypothetical protein